MICFLKSPEWDGNFNKSSVCTVQLNNLQEHSHSGYSVNILMMLFLHLWPRAKEEISSLFQISYAKPVFPMQSISPWSPVSAKHNCILSWALISKIEIISKIAGARGPLPCWHVLQQSSLPEWLRTAGIWLCWLWGGSTFYLDFKEQIFCEAPDTLVHEVPVLMSLQPQVAARKRFLQAPEVTDHALVSLRLWEALSC